MTLDLQRQVITRFPLGAFLAVNGIVVHAWIPRASQASQAFQIHPRDWSDWSWLKQRMKQIETDSQQHLCFRLLAIFTLMVHCSAMAPKWHDPLVRSRRKIERNGCKKKPHMVELEDSHSYFLSRVWVWASWHNLSNHVWLLTLVHSYIHICVLIICFTHFTSAKRYTCTNTWAIPFCHHKNIHI